MKSKIYACFLALLLLSGICFAKDQPLTDDVITDQVRIRLSGDQIVKGGALGVDVKNGVVTLTGVVDEPKAKERAVKITRKTKGVKQVIDKLTVK
jgi:hyperosmotically inducible periplasmic protein